MHPILYVYVYARAFSHTAMHPRCWSRCERIHKSRAGHKAAGTWIPFSPLWAEKYTARTSKLTRRKRHAFDVYRINTRRKKKKSTLTVSASIYIEAREIRVSGYAGKQLTSGQKESGPILRAQECSCREGVTVHGKRAAGS